MRARVRTGRRLLALGLLPLAFLGTVSCGPAVDLRQALEITELAGGWFDAGIVEGRNKLVPSVTMRVRKKMEARISWISLNLVFKKLADPNTEEGFEDVFVQRVEFAEGSQTAPLTVRAQKFSKTATEIPVMPSSSPSENRLPSKLSATNST
jgi:hypothetical protein